MNPSLLAGNWDDAFEAGNSFIVDDNQGVGLGLAITKKLVGLHGGELGVTSTLGEGTTFRFALPLQLAEAWDADVEVKGETPDRPLIPEAPVLIVDDNELNVLVARRMVANWGYEVITASNADEAEAQLAQARPFLVLLDIHMPGRDGFEAARDWKQPSSTWCQIPIVGLTADAESHTRMKALESGMDDVVVKPFNPPHLRAVLERFSAEG